MRGIATCVACIGLALMPVAAIGEERAAPATAPSNSDDGITLDAHQRDIVRKISDYFSGIHTLQGSFLQTGSDNRRMKGKFYLSRPGRFRFDYARPSRQIVISDGQYLAVEDLDLNTEDRVELDQTPFRLILQSDVDLIRDAQIMDVQQSDNLFVVALQDKNPDAGGEITLFPAPSLILRSRRGRRKTPRASKRGSKYPIRQKACSWTPSFSRLRLFYGNSERILNAA
jgi:outer membrane lipoprotein-sorting protein